MPPKDMISEKELAKTEDSFQQRGDRVQVQSYHGTGPSSTFIHCKSKAPYEAYQPPHLSPIAVKRSLNLHLGLPFDPRNVKAIRRICKLISDLLTFVESYLFRLFEAVPLRLRQSFLMKIWSLYLPLHRATLGNRTGIHKDASFEYHALTTVMYWGRLFPVSIRRIRYSLSMLSVWHGPDVYPKIHGYGTKSLTSLIRERDRNVEVIKFDKHKNEVTLMNALSQRESDRPVSGYYVHNENISLNKSKKVLFYLYGGAFLGGDAKGNVLFGSKLSQKCNMDVFIPQYRLLPEYHFFDALDDVVRAYAYLIEVKGFEPENVILFGISSGGGLVLRLLQRIVELQTQKESLQCNQMLNVPRGAVLMSPFVDFTVPKGSFKEYRSQDLIVNESVCDEGVPYLTTLGDDTERYEESPVNRSFEGLPPLCLIVSEHECVYDMNIDMCNKAREAGISVDLGVWKYMCHVWPVLTAFLPEARSAIDFVCDWIDASDNMVKEE
jgi:monoterpene epsilon-lactone hydrolase